MWLIAAIRRRNRLVYAVILLCGLLAIGLRYYYVTHAEVFQPVNQGNVHGDAVDYYDYALNILIRGVYSKTPLSLPPVADSYRDPGYPLFLAGWMKIFTHWNSWYASVLLAQAMLGGFTIMLLLASAKDAMPTNFLMAAGVVMAAWPHSISMTSYLLTETLFGFLCALALYLFKKCLERGSNVWAVACGMAFSLASLTNAILIPFAPLLALYLFVRRKMTGRLAASLAIAAAATMTPWLIRNATLPQPHDSSLNRALTNLIQGSWPSYHSAYQSAMKKDQDSIHLMSIINDETTTIQATHLAGIALIARRMSKDPARYFLWYLWKPALFWAWDIRIGQGDVYVYPTYNSPFRTDAAWRMFAAFCEGLNPILAILAGLGCVLEIRSRTRAQTAISAIVAMILYVTSLYTVLQSEPRYSIPFRGPEILLATFAVYRIRLWLGHVGKICVTPITLPTI